MRWAAAVSCASGPVSERARSQAARAPSTRTSGAGQPQATLRLVWARSMSASGTSKASVALGDRLARAAGPGTSPASRSGVAQTIGSCRPA